MRKIRDNYRWSRIACIILALTVLSCSSVVFTGRNRLLLYSDREIASLSAQSYSDFMSTASPSTNTYQTAMIREVGRRLESALNRYLSSKGETGVLNGISWEYNLVRSSQANAFCLPNGKVVFYEGIMPVLTTPDLVAVVMAHEMGHALARHGNERMTQQALTNIVGSVTGQIIEQRTSEYGRALFESAFSVGSQYGYLLPYSRKHEYEADEIGLYIMAIAGYDINQAPLLWKRMAEAEKQQIPEHLSTHPSDVNRIRHLQKLLPKAARYAEEMKGR